MFLATTLVHADEVIHDNWIHDCLTLVSSTMDFEFCDTTIRKLRSLVMAFASIVFGSFHDTSDNKKRDFVILLFIYSAIMGLIGFTGLQFQRNYYLELVSIAWAIHAALFINCVNFIIVNIPWTISATSLALLLLFNEGTKILVIEFISINP